MQFTKTETFKKGGNNYQNDLKLTKITKNGDTLLPFCILAIEGRVITIQEGLSISQTGTDDPRVQEVIEAIKNPDKPEPKKEKKTTKKASKKKKED